MVVLLAFLPPFLRFDNVGSMGGNHQLSGRTSINTAGPTNALLLNSVVRTSRAAERERGRRRGGGVEREHREEEERTSSAPRHRDRFVPPREWWMARWWLSGAIVAGEWMLVESVRTDNVKRH